jgi:hypothetical protein
MSSRINFLWAGIPALFALGACESTPQHLANLSPTALAAGPVGGDFPEAYDCRRVAVASFDGEGGDWIAGQIEGGLSRLGTYRLVDRRRIAEALEELGFQRSALVDGTTAARVGRIAGADCIITGAVNLARVEQERYSDRRCEMLGRNLPVPEELCPGRMVSVSCTTLKADAVLVPRLVQVESAEIVYAQSASGQASERYCAGDTPATPAALRQDAIENAIGRIVADLTPKGTDSRQVASPGPAPAPQLMPAAGPFEDLGLE